MYWGSSFKAAVASFSAERLLPESSKTENTNYTFLVHTWEFLGAKLASHTNLLSACFLRLQNTSQSLNFNLKVLIRPSKLKRAG